MSKADKRPLAATFRNLHLKKRGMTLKQKKDITDNSNGGYDSHRDNRISNTVTNNNEFGQSNYGEHRKTMTMRSTTIFLQKQRNNQNKLRMLQESIVGPLSIFNQGSTDGNSITYNFKPRGQFALNHHKSQKKLSLNPSKGKLIKGVSNEGNILFTQACVEPTTKGNDLFRKSVVFDVEALVDEQYRFPSPKETKDVEIVEIENQDLEKEH